jgi:hypothetical protein
VSDGCLTALLKVKVILALLGLPWLALLLPQLGDETVTSMAAFLLIAYSFLWLAARPKALFTQLRAFGLRERSIRAVSFGYACLILVVFLPIPFPAWALSLALFAAAVFISACLSAIYFQLQPSTPDETGDDVRAAS